jgi:hypothetical protein
VNREGITVDLVRSLIEEQFSQWSDLPVRPVELDGWDNRTFRLGDETSVHLPSAERYVAQVERTWWSHPCWLESGHQVGPPGWWLHAHPAWPCLLCARGASAGGVGEGS